MAQNGDRIKSHERIATLETEQKNFQISVEGLKKDVKAILENHLPHLKTDIESLKRLIKVVGSGAIIVVIINIVINLIISFK